MPKTAKNAFFKIKVRTENMRTIEIQCIISFLSEKRMCDFAINQMRGKNRATAKIPLSLIVNLYEKKKHFSK